MSLVTGDREHCNGDEQHPSEMLSPRAPSMPNAQKANTQANVTIIQCRADSDAIEGAAIKSTPQAIQATVGICQTRRNSVRSR
jgi:hypothetical protein